MAHQMPTSSVAAQFYNLFFRFLHAILAKIFRSQIQRGFQRFGWVRFGDRNKGYLFRRTMAAARGCLNSSANVRESVAHRLKCIWFRRHSGDNTIEMKL
jgi:hypothetical protein